MAGLENLFVNNPQLPQLQTQKMSEDPSNWAEQLTTKLRELHPDLATVPITIEFKKRDDRAGTAVGALHLVSEQANKSVHVPFIIHNYELSPLDLWMESESQAVHAITPDTFKIAFFTQAPAEGLDARPADAAGNYFNDPSMWTSTYPPLQGRYSYASAGYPLLDAISDTFTTEDLEAFREVLRKEAHLLPLFKKHGHQEILTKIAKLPGKAKVNTNHFAASAFNLIPVGALSLKREGPNKYSLLQSADMMFDLLSSENISYDDCKTMLEKISPRAQDVMHDVDLMGEKMLVGPRPPEEGVFLYDDLRDQPEAANDFAYYRVKSEDGVQIEGMVFPHVVSFAGKKKPYKLFISESHSSMQNQIAGVKEDSLKVKSVFLEQLTGRARVGQTGTFIFIDDGVALATEPVTIKAIEDFGPMTAFTMEGQKIRISRGYSMAEQPLGKGSTPNSKTKYLDVHGMIEQRPNEFVIPRNMAWIPMERFTDVSSTPMDWLEKKAAQHLTLDPLTIRYTGIVYETYCPGEEKLALDQRKLEMLLAVKGTPVEKIAQIIKKANSVGRVKVHGLRPLRKKADIIKEATAALGSLDQVINKLKQTDVLKLAAEIDQSATVDAILGLNFINPENISKFVAYCPIFEKVTDYLAEITLASRLGMRDFSDAAPVLAIHKLQEVIQGLKRMEAGLKKTVTKTAAANGQVKSNDNPFADGMADGEMGGSHLYLEKWRADPKSMLAYMQGKRLAEQNKSMSQMSLGMGPDGKPPKQPKQPATPGAAPAQKMASAKKPKKLLSLAARIAAIGN